MEFISKIYKKYKEAIDYLFWGGVAFVLSMVLFYLFANVMNIYEQIANILSWIICVIFTYLTNRTFVFQSKVKGLKNIFKESVMSFDTAQNIVVVKTMSGLASAAAAARASARVPYLTPSTLASASSIVPSVAPQREQVLGAL